MRYGNPVVEEDLEDLKLSAEQGESVYLMAQTEGWRVLEAHLKEQLSAYVADNATNAPDWNGYLKNSGKIFGIQLLLTDVSDFVEQGKISADRIGEIENKG